jgi:HlyD family secretion protein
LASTVIRLALPVCVAKPPAAIATMLILCLGLPTFAPAAPAQKEVTERSVTVMRTKTVCFADTLQVTGVLVPREEILVRPDREGLQILQVQVEPGDIVVSGQILARLTPPDGQPNSGTGTAVVRAPARGTVISSAAVVGAMASARAAPLFRIAARGDMELLADTTVQSLLSLAPDQAATVDIVGVGELPGKVRMISPAVNPTTQLGQVRVFVGNDTRLRAGAYGRAKIEVDQRCNPAIPLSALLYGPGGAVVQVVRDGRVETRRVIVGLLAGGQAEIREGLSEGDMVVARAGAFLREGDRVRPVSAANETAD